MLALDTESAWKPPIVLTEASRGENVPELWEKIEEHRAVPRGRRACSRSSAAATSPARCSRSPPRGRRRIWSARSPTTPSCGGCSTRCSAGSSTRSRAVREIMRRCSRLTVETAPTLAEIEEARARLDGVARVTPGLPLRDALALIGRARRCSRRRTSSARARSRSAAPSARSRRSRGASGAAGVVAASAGNHGQAVAWAAREAGIKATIFMPQDAPMAKVEPTQNYGARRRADGRDLRGGARGRARLRRGERRDVRPPVRGRARDRRPGDDRARARRAGAGRDDVRDPGRRRRARVGDLARAARGAAGRAASSASRPGSTAGRSPTGSRQVGRRADRPGSSTSRSTTCQRHRRRDLRGDRAPARAREAAWSRARARSASRRCSRARPAARARRSRLLSGGNIDPTLLISVMRHGLDGGRPLPRRAHAASGPAGRADQAADARRAGARRTSSRSSTTARAWTCRSARARSS